MSELGDYIRKIEYEVNEMVKGTKALALRSCDVDLEEGGSL